MRKWSTLILCFVLTLAIPALGRSNPMVVVQEDVLAEIISISRTVVYNYQYYDGPMLVFEEPSPQITISLLIQQRLVGHTVTMDLELLYGVQTNDRFELVAEKRPTFTFKFEIP